MRGSCLIAACACGRARGGEKERTVEKAEAETGLLKLSLHTYRNAPTLVSLCLGGDERRDEACLNERRDEACLRTSDGRLLALPESRGAREPYSEAWEQKRAKESRFSRRKGAEEVRRRRREGVEGERGRGMGATRDLLLITERSQGGAETKEEREKRHIARAVLRIASLLLTHWQR